MISDEKKMELKTLLKQVNVKAICEKRGLRTASVWEALAGKISNTDTLEIVVKIARREVKNRERKLQSL